MDDIFSVTLHIPCDPQTRLEHLHVRRDLAVRRKDESALRVRHRLSNERPEENLRRWRNGIGLLLSFPSQSVVDGEIGRRLPVVLDENPDILLRNYLGARLFDRDSVHAGLLEVQQHWPGDGCADRASARRRRDHQHSRRVAALDVAVTEPHVILETRDRVEDEPPVRKPDERLVLGGSVVLESRLEQVISLHPRDVVERLHARVVRFHRDEERLAEPESVGEVHPGIGERTVLSGNDWSGVRAGPVLARQLESEFVVDEIGQVRDKAPVDRVRVISLDRVGAARPGVHVEGAVLLAGVGVVVLQRSVVHLVDPPIEFDEPHLRVVGAADR